MTKRNLMERLFASAYVDELERTNRQLLVQRDNMEKMLQERCRTSLELETELQVLRDEKCRDVSGSPIAAMETWWENRPKTLLTDEKLNEALGPIGADHPAWVAVLALIRDHEQSYRDALAAPQCAAVDFHRGAATALAHMAYTLERHRVAAQAAVEGAE